MQNLNNSYINIEDNVNVSEPNDFNAFFKLAALIVSICVGIYFAIHVTCNVVIQNLSPENQASLEKALSSEVNSQFNNSIVANSEYTTKLKNLEQKITPLNKTLREHGEFNINVIKKDEVNAFVTADGSIFFTEKLLKEVQNDEQLCFVLAHEMGHYIHKDHLKALSRGVSGIAVGITMAVLTGGNEDIGKVVNGSLNFAEMNHSKNDELMADAFANKVVIALYGDNKEAIEFFKYIDKTDKAENFLYFFSTHPSPEERIKYLQKAK